MGSLRKKLALATCTLIAQGAQAASGDWDVDQSYLLYKEADNRVSVNKYLADMNRKLDNGSVAVNLVYDTMSGASPTGALRSSESVVSFTSASGASFDAQSGGDNSISQFDDTRVQLGIDRKKELKRLLGFSYGGVISQESDYDSFGTSLGISKESANRLTTLDAGVAFTGDSIYRSSNGDTPVPLGDINDRGSFGKGTRYTYDTLLGVTRIINRRTIAQLNVSFSLSQGYHSDPYKVISAADENDTIRANFHDSRPESRQRSTLYGRVVHELAGKEDSINASYRLYKDDWGVLSNTADVRYHYVLTKKQYLEPHFRYYRQSAADFYNRKFDIDEQFDPILPENGLATADYRLDAQNSFTVGMKYGVTINPYFDVRVRTEYIGKSFAQSEFSTNNATIFQFSLRARF